MQQFKPTLTKFIPFRRIALPRNYFQILNWKGMAGIIIGLGIIFRIVPYLFNRSLWLDEALLALNILHKPLSELSGPLDHKQIAPMGFLFIEKFLALALGENEYSLRLFPLLAGILALFLFYAVARRILTVRGLLIALGLFAISSPLIRYSSELKQYSSDVAIALGIYLFGLVCIEKESRYIFFLWLFSITGSILLWFSHPAVFSLAGAGITLTYHWIKSGKRAQIAWLFVPAGFWLGSFALHYFIGHLDLSHHPEMVKAWSGTTVFMPTEPFSLGDLIWYPQKFFTMLSNPGGFSFVGLAALCFISGWIALFVEKHYAWLILTLPFLFTLLASSLHLYPFQSRLILFLAPSMLIFISEGVDRTLSLAHPKSRVFGVTLCVLLFFAALKNSAPNVFIPENLEREAIRPVMINLKNNYQEGDKVFLYYAAWPAFKYYTKQLNLEEMAFQTGNSYHYHWDGYVNELRELKGNPRVWILLSHVRKTSGIDEEKFFLYTLNGMGKQLTAFKGKGASIYLYDLTQPTRSENFPQS
jgi:hypothetical protein